MNGHEYVREVLRTYLETEVPARLRLHLTANSLTTPDPDRVTVTLGDSLAHVQEWPAVVVRSASARLEKVLTSTTFLYRYDVEVIVAARSRLAGDDDGGSLDRDRVSLATREALLLASGLPDGMHITPAGTTEENGVAAESLPGQPIAAGTLKVIALVQETIAPATAPETIDHADLDVQARDASQSLED